MNAVITWTPWSILVVSLIGLTAMVIGGVVHVRERNVIEERARLQEQLRQERLRQEALRKECAPHLNPKYPYLETETDFPTVLKMPRKKITRTPRTRKR